MTTKLWAALLVLFTSFLTSSAQILWKIGSATLTFNILSILKNYYLIVGLLLYVVGGVLLVISFRGGEVSVLYPLFATSYIWVSLLSGIFLREAVTIYKWAGVGLIIAGIASIGYGSKSSADSASEL